MFLRTTLCYFILCSTHFALAQHHVIKGRLFALPGNLAVSSIGIGYERVFANQNAIQLLFNRNVVDMRETDGSKDVFVTLIPEVKHYFRPPEALHKSAYLAAFLEMRHYYASGGSFNEKSLAPGLLIGQHLHFSRKWYLEAYTGPLYRFAKEAYNMSDNGVVSLEKRAFSRFGWRFGFNLAYKI